MVSYETVRRWVNHFGPWALGPGAARADFLVELRDSNRDALGDALSNLRATASMLIELATSRTCARSGLRISRAGIRRSSRGIYARSSGGNRSLRDARAGDEEAANHPGFRAAALRLQMVCQMVCQGRPRFELQLFVVGMISAFNRICSLSGDSSDFVRSLCVSAPAFRAYQVHSSR